MEQVFDRTCSCLEAAIEKKEVFHVFTGFDGYVDTLVKPVRSFDTDGTPSFFSTISEFGEYLITKAGKSCSLDLHKIVEKVGGNAPIYASAVSALGVEAACVGAFGYPQIQENFSRIGDRVKMVTISEPGKCMALEFNDGKVMLGENEGINDISYELLKERPGEDELYRMIDDADMISLMNWSEVPGTTDIWQGMLEHIFPKLTEKRRCLLISRTVQDAARRISGGCWKYSDSFQRTVR